MTMTEVNIQNCVFRNYIEHMYSERQTSDAWSLGPHRTVQYDTNAIQAHQTTQCVRGFHILDLATTFKTVLELNTTIIQDYMNFYQHSYRGHLIIPEEKA